jgi:hypothetical protein
LAQRFNLRCRLDAAVRDDLLDHSQPSFEALNKRGK